MELETLIFSSLCLLLGFLTGYFLVERRVSAALKERTTLEMEVVRLTEQLNSAKNLIQEGPEKLAMLSEKMNANFKSLADEVLERKSLNLEENQRNQLASVLGPLEQGLKAFRHQVERSHVDEIRDRAVLREELKRMQSANNEMQEQAGLLTQALKGDVRSQGVWGELVLERVLEYSGLNKGRDYLLQGEGMGLKNSEGRAQKPDVVVQLPENKHIIIDSKVTLEPYRRIIKEDSIEHQASFIKSLKSHVDNLSGKEYFKNDKLITPEFVLLFFPIEGALSRAMELDDSLFHYGWEKSVVIVTPANLIATLKTVASLWRVERQNKNASDIAKEAGLLYEKFAGFVKDLEEVGKSLEQANHAYHDSFKKLRSGRGNIFSKMDKLKALGAKTEKRLPRAMVDEAFLADRGGSNLS